MGCAELLTTIRERVLPKYHVFGKSLKKDTLIIYICMSSNWAFKGHIHENYGSWRDNKNVTYINASTCNRRYLPLNPTILVDIDLPEGVTKMNLP